MTQIPEDLINLVEELVIYKDSQTQEYIENLLELELEYPNYQYEEKKEEENNNSIIYIQL